MIEIPKKPFKLLKTGEDCYLFGGRMGYKSTVVAQHIITEALDEKHKDEVFLCAREYQISIKNSSYSVILNWIERMGLLHEFTVLNDEIRANDTGVRIVFKGLQDTTSIKSIDGLSLVWIEEGETLKQRSFNDVYDTAIRHKNSQMIVTMNLRKKTDFSFKLVEEVYDQAMACAGGLEFFTVEHDGDKVNVIYVNYKANRWLPEKALEKIIKLKKKDYEAYQQRYLGAVRQSNKAAVIGSQYWTIAKVEYDRTCQPLQGLDFGFSTDPTAAIASYIKDNCLFIYAACGKVGLDTSDMAAYIDKRIPTFKRNKIVADSARPETISHLKNKGDIKFPMIVGAKKGKGSIEDGIEFIKSFDMIYIDESLDDVIYEFTEYSYKLDKTTEEPTTDILDENNHYIDALRYSLEDAKNIINWKSLL